MKKIIRRLSKRRNAALTEHAEPPRLEPEDEKPRTESKEGDLGMEPKEEQVKMEPKEEQRGKQPLLPGMKPKATLTALYSYTARDPGDLSFEKGENDYTYVQRTVTKYFKFNALL